MFSIVHTTTVHVRVIKQLHCEKCENLYVYPINIHAEGSGGAPLGIGSNRAKRESARELEKDIHSAAMYCDGKVACPTCGTYPRLILDAIAETAQERKGRILTELLYALVVPTSLIVFGVIGALGRFHKDVRTLGWIWVGIGILLFGAITWVRNLVEKRQFNEPAPSGETIRENRQQAVVFGAMMYDQFVTQFGALEQHEQVVEGVAWVCPTNYPTPTISIDSETPKYLTKRAARRFDSL